MCIRKFFFLVMFCSFLGLCMVDVALTQTQTIQLKERSYEKFDGEWFLQVNGKRENRVLPHYLIVRLNDRSDPGNFQFSSIGVSGVSVVSKEFFGGYYVLEVDKTFEPISVGLTLAKQAAFDFVEFDALIEFSDSTPNDPLYVPDQWNLDRIQMPKAWDISTGDASVIVAIHDSGTDIAHPDLDANIWQNVAEVNGTTGVDDDGNGYVDDKYGWNFTDGNNALVGVDDHGTQVAGIAAEETNNPEGGDSNVCVY